MDRGRCCAVVPQRGLLAALVPPLLAVGVAGPTGDADFFLPRAFASSPAVDPSALTADVSESDLGCFFYGYRFNTLDIDTHSPLPDVASVRQCQGLCAAADGCKLFAYFAATSLCWLGGDATALVADTGATSGPRACPAVSPLCTTTPDSSFPGATAKATFLAWPGAALQPPPLQCWPRDKSGKPSPCGHLTILDDSHAGWNGACLGLKEVSEPHSETCGMSCQENPECPSFQTVISEGLMRCWHGVGIKCDDAPRGLEILSAKRFMRGTYRVLMPLLQITIVGMTKVGNAVSTQENQIDAVRNCNHTCLSDVKCQAWQYSAVWGCYADIGGIIKYPAISPSVFYYNSTFVERVVAGEYIQRFCDPPPPALTSLSAASPMVTWASSAQLARERGPLQVPTHTTAAASNSSASTTTSLATYSTATNGTNTVAENVTSLDEDGAAVATSSPKASPDTKTLVLYPSRQGTTPSRLAFIALATLAVLLFIGCVLPFAWQRIRRCLKHDYESVSDEESRNRRVPTWSKDMRSSFGADEKGELEADMVYASRDVAPVEEVVRLLQPQPYLAPRQMGGLTPPVGLSFMVTPTKAEHYAGACRGEAADGGYVGEYGNGGYAEFDEAFERLDANRDGVISRAIFAFPSGTSAMPA